MALFHTPHQLHAGSSNPAQVQYLSLHANNPVIHPLPPTNRSRDKPSGRLPSSRSANLYCLRPCPLAESGTSRPSLSGAFLDLQEQCLVDFSPSLLFPDARLYIFLQAALIPRQLLG